MDFWRVETADPQRRLRLHAEMRLPGDAWSTRWPSLSGDGGTFVTHTAQFRPRGVLGRFYWLAVAPFHRFVFPTLLGESLPNPNRAARRAPRCARYG